MKGEEDIEEDGRGRKGSERWGGKGRKKENGRSKQEGLEEMRSRLRRVKKWKRKGVVIKRDVRKWEAGLEGGGRGVKESEIRGEIVKGKGISCEEKRCIRIKEIETKKKSQL